MDKNFRVFDGVSEIFIKALERRRVKFIVHIIRHNEFVIKIIEDKGLSKKVQRSP